jgi:ribonuclease P protein component
MKLIGAYQLGDRSDCRLAPSFFLCRLLEPEWRHFNAVRTSISFGIAMNTSFQSDQRRFSRRSLKGARLRRHADYQRAYAASRKRQSASMSWFLAPQSSALDFEAGPRVGLTAGKVLGKAHERNRIKRRMREALRRHVELLPPGCDLILHPRRAVLTADFRKLEAEVVRILQQARIEAARMARPTPPQAAGRTS